jgi:hypothetical protein
MADREYWQSYRDGLKSRVELMRAATTNRFSAAHQASDAGSTPTHQDIRELRRLREAEQHLAAVEKLLARDGQLE